jgi:hypothetical protein
MTFFLGPLPCFVGAWLVWTVCGSIHPHRAETRSREAATQPVIRAELDSELADCRAESYLSSEVFIVAVLGAFSIFVGLDMLGWGLANWRRWPRDLLGAKLVRLFLADKRKQMTPESDS